ncbi:hypothetical protein CJ671_09760 [Aliarcobacter cryaerophilus]|uniref:SDR family oxidoreductase n=1 Tax=Aliarcobacter cryaerophilus TaxID=28198 RepID=A0A2S9SMD0_9BACT|nr:SDR family oxidoreductase [Aliarcobacter cryaerophilus]PRM87734.1 hypothetical protein CJ671_09760 [Aliarcobacter cryaerophilus]
MITFQDKKILVTGSSSGIGREISIQLSRLGAKVILLGRDEEKLKKSFSMLEGIGHKYFVYDLKQIEGIKDLVESFIEYDNIKLDGFIHSAGVPSVYPLKIITHDKFNETMDINTYSYLEIIKYFSKKNISNDYSSIVFISSILTKLPKKAQTLYVASKAASDSMSKVLSQELFKRRIRINSVLVGGVLTEMVENTEIFRMLGNESVAEDYNTIYKTLSTQEVSNMVLFLMSESAKYIIGESYHIDGGYF